MGKNTLEQLGQMVREKRADRGIREAAAEVGVSPATLSRVEGGSQPDLETFSRICKWLGVDASEMLGFEPTEATPAQQSPVRVAQAHFRADKAMSSETANHLAKLILKVQEVASRDDE